MWICFLDSDDFWAEIKLEETFKNINLKPNVDIWTSGYFVFNDNEIISERAPSKLINKFSFESLLLYSNPFVTSAVAIKKEKIGSTRFDEARDIVSTEDLDFLISLSLKGLEADKISKSLVFYYYNEVGISKNYEKHLSSLEYFFNKYKNKHTFFFKTRVLSNFNWIKSSILFQNNKIILSFYFLCLSLICSPLDRLIYMYKYYKK